MAKECEACGQPGTHVVQQVGGHVAPGTTLCNVCAKHRGAFAVMATCEICGGETDVVFPDGIGGFARLAGVPVCNHHGRLWSDIGMLLSSRRSAKQEPTVVEGVPAEWREHIGKRVRYCGAGGNHYFDGILLGNAKAILGSKHQSCMAAVEVDKQWASYSGDLSTREPAEWQLLTRLPASGGAQQTPSTAAPVGPPDPPLCKPEDCDRLYTKSASGRCDGCGVKHEARAAGPPGPSLSAFTAAVREHLEPRLPKGFRCVTDSYHDEDDGSEWFAIWVLDDKGRQVTHDSFDDVLTERGASGVYDQVRLEVFEKMARVQPYTEPAAESFEARYLKGAGS